MDGKSRLVVVVDDEPDILELIEIYLTSSGYDVELFEDIPSFYSFLKKKMPDLVILDLMLPGYDGLEVCRDFRGDILYKHIPLIILTAKASETDRVLGLEMGADDYIVKPFSPRELVARVKNLFKRTTFIKENVNDILKIGDELWLDIKGYRAYQREKVLDLTTTEFKILKMLGRRMGIVFSREEILSHLWGYEKSVLDRTVDVHIRNLREKLGNLGYLIKNVRGVGYKLDLLLS
ncbi:hypothetical protein AB834_04125 [PVC group bacterium (ex Bugula neritina AB1)]|nr:hypothetical protein AB834_04125 [PVC group bacterium (ex Bugula neritina AB1)]